MNEPHYLRQSDLGKDFWKEIEIPLGTINQRFRWTDEYKWKPEPVTGLDKVIDEHFPGIPRENVIMSLHRRAFSDKCTIYLVLQTGKVPPNCGPN